MGPKQPRSLDAESGRHLHDLKEYARGAEREDTKLELGGQEAELGEGCHRIWYAQCYRLVLDMGVEWDTFFPK
jgi:hypothetical protein